MEDNTVFGTKLVSEIKGSFFIESYQRGYRWEKSEVQTLLEDIYENGVDTEDRILKMRKKRYGDNFEEEYDRKMRSIII